MYASYLQEICLANLEKTYTYRNETELYNQDLWLILFYPVHKFSLIQIKRNRIEIIFQINILAA